MPCMCGDFACPSCGPAQGADLEHEAVCEALVTALPEGLVEVLEEAGWEDKEGDAYSHIVQLIDKARQDALDDVRSHVESLMTDRTVHGIVDVLHPALAKSMPGVETCKRVWEFVEGQPHPSRTDEEKREWGW